MADFKRISKVLAASFSLWNIALAIFGGCGTSHPRDDEIARVENNLLPPVLIEGEEPYNLADRMAFYKVPGVSIAVIKDFSIEWVKHYGVRDVELGEPVTDSTLFCVGSLSKAAAAATILHLVDQGHIGLDDNINRYLKSWKVPENEFTRKSAVTIRRLMNHSGGLMHSPPHAYAPDHMPTLIQYLTSEPPLNIQPTVVDYEPGTKFKYSNAGFSALQILAEDISGKPYAVFARQVLFDPLNMKYSTFEQPLPREKELYAAAGHKADGTVNEIKRYAYPSETAGGLWTTAEEYARLIIEIQRALKGESNLIMSQELARQMTSPQEAKEYGLGVFMTYTDSVTYFSHIGDARGFVAGFVAHPTAGYGAVVTTNSNNGMALISEILFGIAKVYGWQTLLPPTHALCKLEDTVKAHYVGRYRIGFDDVATVSEKGGNLFCQTAEMGESRLYPISRDTMLFKERLEQLVFEWDADGTVSTCIIISGAGTGRSETRAIKMAAGEMTPMERLLSSDAEGAIAAYKKIKIDFPDDPGVAEARFNNLGYRLLNEHKLAEALAVFQLNIVLYPNSGNCWDSMGEALVAAGRKEEALSHYRKALELNPSNGNAARWIEKLESEL